MPGKSQGDVSESRDLGLTLLPGSQTSQGKRRRLLPKQFISPNTEQRYGESTPPSATEQDCRPQESTPQAPTRFEKHASPSTTTVLHDSPTGKSQFASLSDAQGFIALSGDDGLSKRITERPKINPQQVSSVRPADPANSVSPARDSRVSSLASPHDSSQPRFETSSQETKASVVRQANQRESRLGSRPRLSRSLSEPPEAHPTHTYHQPPYFLTGHESTYAAAIGPFRQRSEKNSQKPRSWTKHFPSALVGKRGQAQIPNHPISMQNPQRTELAARSFLPQPNFSVIPPYQILDYSHKNLNLWHNLTSPPRPKFTSSVSRLQSPHGRLSARQRKHSSMESPGNDGYLNLNSALSAADGSENDQPCFIDDSLNTLDSILCPAETAPNCNFSSSDPRGRITYIEHQLQAQINSTHNAEVKVHQVHAKYEGIVSQNADLNRENGLLRRDNFALQQGNIALQHRLDAVVDYIKSRLGPHAMADVPTQEVTINPPSTLYHSRATSTSPSTTGSPSSKKQNVDRFASKAVSKENLKKRKQFAAEYGEGSERFNDECSKLKTLTGRESKVGHRAKITLKGAKKSRKRSQAQSSTSISTHPTGQCLASIAYNADPSTQAMSTAGFSTQLLSHAASAEASPEFNAGAYEHATDQGALTGAFSLPNAGFPTESSGQGTVSEAHMPFTSDPLNDEFGQQFDTFAGNMDAAENFMQEYLAIDGLYFGISGSP